MTRRTCPCGPAHPRLTETGKYPQKFYTHRKNWKSTKWVREARRLDGCIQWFGLSTQPGSEITSWEIIKMICCPFSCFTIEMSRHLEERYCKVKYYTHTHNTQSSERASLSLFIYQLSDLHCSVLFPSCFLLPNCTETLGSSSKPFKLCRYTHERPALTHPHPISSCS